MSDEEKVGYKNPPRHSRWQPGQSGNQGRRKIKKTTGLIDASMILDRPVKAKVGERIVEIDPYEASFTALTHKAMGGCLRSAALMLQSCERAGVLVQAEGRDGAGIACRIPWEWDSEEWMEMFKRHGPPPWPGERDGLVPPERGGRT